MTFYYPGTPLQPMLGSITRSLTEVYTRLGSRPFVSEAKLDGQRGQIHVALEAPTGESGRGTWYDPTQSGAKGERIWVRLFSRHLEDQTDKYPDMFPTLSVSLQCGTFEERIFVSSNSLYQRLSWSENHRETIH